MLVPVLLSTPVKLCAICARAESDCLGGDDPRPHIYDGLGYFWCVQDSADQVIASYHVTKEEARIAASAG